MQQTGGVFQTGPNSNFLIQGGQFVQNAPAQPAHNCYDADDGLKHLQAHVAPTAYATQQEGDAPKCHPNTRTAILDAIMEWIFAATTGLQWMLWINGAAGAGKSAIGRSVVDLCLQQNIIIVRFFFFRTDPSRNSIKPVVATLAYQLIQSIPALDPIITPKIRSNPLIFMESLETQFTVLIFESLQQLHQEAPLQKSVVFLVDGVDECTGHDNQTNLIHTIAQFVAKKAVPMIVIFASRAELQLQMAFNSRNVDNILKRIALDSDYRADDDIRLFLNDSFDNIKDTHPFRSSIDPKWPTASLLQEIVDKSSNQFIYASVVIRFLSSPRLHPIQQLEIVRGLRPAGKLTPFAQLDALYRHIFSQVNDITRVTEILAVTIFSGSPTLTHICNMLGITKYDMYSALADLNSVITHDGIKIIFLHASLPDFLLDQSRAQQYFLEKSHWSEQLSIKYMKNGGAMLYIVNRYISKANCTRELRNALYSSKPSDYYANGGPSIEEVLNYIDIVHMMDFGDNGELYRHQLDLVVRFAHIKRWAEHMHYFSEKHDIEGILDQIKLEEQRHGTLRSWLKKKIHR